MQRKNYFLNLPSQRSGIAMIMAITILLVISTIMALSLALTVTTGKKTTDIYLHEQAALYAKSAAELALLDIAQNGCIDNIITSFDNNLYDVNVTMLYIYTGTVGTCTNYFNIATPEQNGSVLMDITVTSTAGTEPIRYFRRSIQKL